MIPRAGPKYRLGMYFDTIYGLSEFDQVREPEDGYMSHWETETEIDDELGNFIFSNVTGDSASLICIDEAMDLLAIREQQQQLYDGGTELQPDQMLSQDDNPLERSTDSKASRHSHHSGSDGTYEGPTQTSPTPLQRPSTSQEHIYETLDDCRDNYETHMEGIYVSKGSDGSRGSTDSTAKPVTRLSDDTDSFYPVKNAFKSPTHRHMSKPRSMSLPQPPEGFYPHHRRKLSESEFPRRKKQHCGEKVAPRTLLTSPVRGYPFPPGIPDDYAEYMAVPSTPPSPTKRHSEGRKPARGPSLIIKHKGKTFLIPVVDKKMKEKWEKAKQAAHERSKLRGTPAPVYTFPRHATLNTAAISRSNSSACSNGAYQTIVPVSRRHASPPKVETCDQTTAHKKRVRLPSQSIVSHNAAQQVTHYGVV